MEAPQFPLVLGGYAVFRQLAEKRSSDVYLAVGGAANEEIPCALKMRRRPARSLNTVDRIAHENLVNLLDIGDTDGAVYLAMEYVHGHDLFHVWNTCSEKRTPIPTAVAVRIVGDVLAGLDHLHARGATYGLLCPEKVMVPYDGPVKLLDYQTVRSFVGKRPGGHSYARLGYFAPEQARGEPPTIAADVFAAGVVLWELLVGRPLFPRPRISAYDAVPTYEKALLTLAVAPSKANVRVPRNLDSIVGRALALAPEDRFASAGEFLAALEDAVPAIGRDRSSPSAFVRSLYEDNLAWENRQLDTAIKGGRMLLQNLAPALRRPRKSVQAQLSGRDRPGEMVRPRRGRSATRAWAGISTAALLTVGAVAWWRGGLTPQRGTSPRAVVAPIVRAASASPRREAGPAPAPSPPPPSLVPTADSLPTVATTRATTTSTVASERTKRGVPSAKSLIKAASAAFDRGDFVAARHEAKTAVDEGGGAPAFLLLGDIYVQKGETETDAQRRKDAYQKAAARYADALKLAPRDPQVQKRQDLVQRLMSGIATDHPVRSSSPAPDAMK